MPGGASSLPGSNRADMPTSTQERRQFGARLRAARQARGLSQEELAEEVGTSLESVSRAERGVVWPSVPALRRLADVLAVPADELLRGGAFEPAAHRPSVERIARLLDHWDEEGLEGLALFLKHSRRTGDAARAPAIRKRRGAR